jgi:hypothetical protein
MLFFYQARCALCPNDHRLHIFPFLLCYVRMMSVHSVLHEAFAQRLSGMFFPIENALCGTYLSTPSPKRAKSPLIGSSGQISRTFRLAISLLLPCYPPFQLSIVHCQLSVVN